MLKDLMQNLSSLQASLEDTKKGIDKSIESLKQNEHSRGLANELEGAIKHAFNTNDLTKLNKIIKDVTTNNTK